MEDLAGEKIRSWNILNRAGRSQLRSDPVFLAKVFKCVDHSELISLGIDDQYLINIAASLSGDFSQAGSQIIIEDVPTILTPSKAQLLEDEIFDVLSSFGDFLGNNSPATYGNLYEKVIEPLEGRYLVIEKGRLGYLNSYRIPLLISRGRICYSKFLRLMPGVQLPGLMFRSIITGMRSRIALPVSPQPP